MSSPFESLLREFTASKGMAFAEGTLGLEFESEGTDVFVVQHALHEDHVLVEVTVTLLNPLQQASLAPLMLQINEVSRFEHDWTIVMDAQGQVLLSTSAAIATTSVAELEDLMSDGVERAQTLAAMLTAVERDEPLVAPLDPAIDTMAQMMMMRG